MRLLTTIGKCAGGALVLLAFTAACALWFLDWKGVTPRMLARDQPWAAPALLAVERRAGGVIAMDPLTIGAGPAGRAPAAQSRAVAVSSATALRLAIAAALPGDVITLAAGSYRIAGTAIAVHRPGAAAAPITVRGPVAGGAVIEIDTVEGFVVSAPYWRFEHLSLRGVCGRHGNCEHAFHVVGGAHHFTAFGNAIADFNAHFKINGSDGQYPDYGTIDTNTLDNNAPRDTANPVTPIDLVAASHWRIRRNLIADFIKLGGDGISYGAFAKGGGAHNLFEQNIVWCERRLRGLPGQRVGLSLGGGGTAPQYCRDARCVTEQDDSVIASNLVASCSDDGVYLNSAARATVVHNTLAGTAGMTLSAPTTAANLEGNLVDGPLRSRGGAIAHASDNLTRPVAWRYFGLERGWLGADGLAWIGAAPRRAPAAAPPSDLCGATRPAAPTYGAFEDFSACRAAASTR